MWALESVGMGSGGGLFVFLATQEVSYHQKQEKPWHHLLDDSQDLVYPLLFLSLERLFLS